MKITDFTIEELARHPELLEEMAKLFFSEWHFLLPPGSTSQLVKENLQKRMQIGKIPITYVALNAAGNFVGSISIKEKDMDTHPEMSPWLAGLYVKEEFRNWGLGGKLIEFLLEKAREFQINKLYLYTPAAEAYYRKKGWKLLFTENYYNCDVSVMQLDL